MNKVENNQGRFKVNLRLLHTYVHHTHTGAHTYANMNIHMHTHLYMRKKTQISLTSNIQKVKAIQMPTKGRMNCNL